MLLVCFEVNAKVTINEIMPCNVSTHIDDKFNFNPYVEFYSDSKFDLLGATITHQRDTKIMWSYTVQKSHIIPSGYSILFFGDDKESSSVDGVNLGHMPEKFEYKASSLTITKGDSVIASISYPLQVAGLSYGPEGYMVPSPGEENNVAYEDLSKRAPKPSFDPASKPGVYLSESSMEVTINVPEGTSVYYSTNGSEPRKDNTGVKKYTEPFKIKKSCAVRARAYKSGTLFSQDLVGSFILENDNYYLCEGKDLPIVHLITDSTYLYGKTLGICVKGSNGIRGEGCNDVEANYNRDWDRPAIFEYYEDGDLKLSQLVEVGVFGGCSRKYDVKSLKMKVSKKTGNNRYDYTDFFKEKPISELKSVQIRNGGNGYEGIICRDGFMQSLCKGMGIDYQAYQPVAYYINGVYQRLMGLRERTNADFVFHNYGYDEDEIEHLEIAKEHILATEGDTARYNEMINYVENHYNDDDFYDRLGEYMDIEEYISWQIFEEYIVNTDWPANNTKIWRNKKDGKFRWILYDTDFGFGIYGGGGPNYTAEWIDMISFACGEGSNVNWANGTQVGKDSYQFDEKSKWKTTLIKHCLKNKDFQRRFVKRYREMIAKNFEPEKVAAVWDSIATMVEKDYCATKDYDDIYSAGKALTSFAKKRPAYALEHLMNHFGMSDSPAKVKFSVKSEEPVKDFAFLFNKQRYDKTSYEYSALKGESVKIEPIIPRGYKIDGWELSDKVSKTSPLITSSSIWKYFYKDTCPLGAWNEVGYDDTAWENGKGMMGYGGSYEYKTPLDYGGDDENRYMTAYFRYNLNFEKGSVPESVFFKLAYDDGFVLYVNGKEIDRSNLPKDTAITYSTEAIEFVNDVTKTIELDGSLFKEGENVIAVEIHQVNSKSSDLVFCGTASASVETGSASDKFFESDIAGDIEVVLLVSPDSSCVTPKMYVNEICSSNNEYMDKWGAKPDWIEIYNAEDYPVDLAGMVLKNLNKANSKYTFPSGSTETIIPAKGHKVVWASKDVNDSPLHIGFKLSAANAYEIALYDVIRGEEILVNSMKYEVHEQNGSYGRVSDGADSMKVFYSCMSYLNTNQIIPSPAKANGELCLTFANDDVVDSLKETKGIQLYPNPASDVLFIALTNEVSGDWSIMDCNGRTIKSGCIVDGKTVAEISELPAAVYTVRVVTADNVYTDIFIKR